MQLIGGIIIGWLHVMAAVLIVGGSYLINVVVSPLLAKELDPPVAGKISQQIGKRFTTLVWAGLIILLLTGLVRGFGAGQVTVDTLFSTNYGIVLVAKIALFIVAVILAAAITFTSVKVGKLSVTTPPPMDEIGAAVGRIKTLATINMINAFVIILLAVALRFLAA